MPQRRIYSAIINGVAAILCACSAGSGGGLDVAGRPSSPDGGVAPAPTLAFLQGELFDASCIICHAGANAPLGLRLDTENSFNNLVGVPSRQQGSLLRVDPGQPAQSYLIQKLEGRASEGAQMPLGGPPVPQEIINFARQWILDGAQASASDTQPISPPVVTSFTPEPGAALPSLPAQIVVGFDQEIDASTVNEMTIEILRSGDDGEFESGNERAVPISAFSLATANPRLALIDIRGAAAIDDAYQVTIRGSGGSLLLSIGGRALDGEFSGSLPSGDGIEGGDFVATFWVRSIQANLQSIQDNVFAVSCSPGCHTGPTSSNLPSGMDLSSAAASFASLVGVNSLQSPAQFRVSAGDASTSYLVQKIEGTATVGGRMPLASAPLDQVTIDAIRLWINDGANP